MKEIGELFSDLGGEFLIPPEEIKRKYESLRVLVFDWDGVFNNSLKYPEGGSLFSESDSMGINLLRFNYYLIHHQFLRTFIITGLNNSLAVNFAKRENFDSIYVNFKFKEEALDKIVKQTGCRPEETGFVFDDVLDFGVAGKCLLSFFVRRTASPLTSRYAMDKKLCDYVTGMEGGDHPVREICELLMGLSGRFDETIEKRIKFKGIYEEYFTARKKIIPEIIGAD